MLVYRFTLKRETYDRVENNDSRTYLLFGLSVRQYLCRINVDNADKAHIDQRREGNVIFLRVAVKTWLLMVFKHATYTDKC